VGATATNQGNDQDETVVDNFPTTLFGNAMSQGINLAVYGLSIGESIGVHYAAFILSVFNCGAGIADCGVLLNVQTFFPATE